MKCDNCKGKMVQVANFIGISYVCETSEVYKIWIKKLKDDKNE